MHLFDLGLLPRLLTDQTKAIDDETASDHALRARQLDALFVALLPVGMRVVCMETVGIVAGWARMPGAPATEPLSPFFAHAEPFAAGPGSVNPVTGFTTRSNTYLPALRARIIVDAATIPHLCKVIAESFGKLHTLGESYGIRREGGRWSILSTHGWRWDLDFTPRNFPASPEEAVIAVLTARLEELASVYDGRAPERIG